jgi:hypothetical protein
LLITVAFACGSPAQSPKGAPPPAATAAHDIEEISLEISSLM